MDAEKFLIVPDSLFKRIERFLVFKVSDEVADKGVAVPCQAKRILKLRACTQNWFLCPRNLHLTRRVAPRAAHKVRLITQRCYHGIIHTHMDRAVLHQEGVRERSEPLTGLLVPVSQRLLAQVSAGHHQYIRKAWLRLEQEQMQRRVWEHKTQPGPVRRNDFGKFLAGACSFCQHNRRLG